jgi:CheY-like chemotaxis protein
VTDGFDPALTGTGYYGDQDRTYSASQAARAAFSTMLVPFDWRKNRKPLGIRAAVRPVEDRLRNWTDQRESSVDKSLGSFTSGERLPLIYFMVIFPVLVLGVFGWLVSHHSGKLFAPGDFRDERNYVRAITATASLTVAAVKNNPSASAAEIKSVVESVLEASAPSGQEPRRTYWKSHVLWVDDRPDNNINERNAFEAMGISFSLALTTEEALAHVNERRFAAIISDMGRDESQIEGYVLLDKIRRSGNQTPFFFYTAFSTIGDKRDAVEHGGQGHTNNPEELFRAVMRAVLNR